MLMQAKHIEIRHAAWMVVAFEAFGLMGALIGGRLTDRWLAGAPREMCLIYMILAGVSVLVFWKVPVKSELLTTAMLGAVGFFVYGPQCLLAVTAANLATKRAAGTAVGLTSIFGYASTVLSGWGLGRLVEDHGWDAAFWMLLIAAIAGSLLFIAAWPGEGARIQELNAADQMKKERSQSQFTEFVNAGIVYCFARKAAGCALIQSFHFQRYGCDTCRTR